LDSSGATLAYIDRELMHVEFMWRSGHMDVDDWQRFRDTLRERKKEAILRAGKCQT
jgi:hypothetical protein